MANILVYMELEQSAARAPGEDQIPGACGSLTAGAASLGALLEGRRLCSRLGATLYALLPFPAPPSYDDDDVIAVLSRHGADKVILATNPGLGLAPDPGLTRRATQMAVQRFPPRLVLLADSAAAPDLAHNIAAQIQGETRSLRLPDPADSGDAELLEGQRPLVLVLEPAEASGACCDEEAEVIVLHVEG